VTYLTKDDPPLLIFHGDKDELVPLSQSEHVHKLYQELGLESSLHVIEGAGHGLGIATGLSRCTQPNSSTAESGPWTQPAPFF
jgi:acetyl esterase/lipase